MTDFVSRKKRSKIMAAIKGKNTSIELLFRKLLWQNELGGYRIHYNLPGKPDIVYVSRKLAIFIDGDFWHGYTWKKIGKVPPKKYWQKKINDNIKRDKRNNILLRKMGWTVIRLWEHDVNKNINQCLNKIKKELK